MLALNILRCLVLAFYHILESLILSSVPPSLRYKDIKGQIVLITGGGSGIGRCLALCFANHGAKIVVWDLNLSGAQDTVNMVKNKGGEAFAYRCDVSKPKDVYNTADKVKHEVGKVDILVNNAGIVHGKKLLDCPDEKIKSTFEVNSLAHFWTCKAFLPDMMTENNGHIVSISSEAGHVGAARLTDYCASKYAVVGFEESLRMELLAEGYDGIKSSVVCPSFVNTGLFEGINTGPLDFMTPEYVAGTIVSAVLTNQEIIFVPGYLALLNALKAVTPTKFLYVLTSIFGTNQAMDNFIGRQNTDTSTVSTR